MKQCLETVEFLISLLSVEKKKVTYLLFFWQLSTLKIIKVQITECNSNSRQHKLN